MFLLTMILALVPALVLSVPAFELPADVKIPRFQAVSQDLYRGGQPDEKGFAFLKGKGIRTIISFRVEGGQVEEEAAIVTRLGMKHIQIPIKDPRPWSKIPDAAIAKYFDVVSDPANGPVFFHCRRGADRTGALTAFYRIANQGWDAKEAYSEARRIGLRWWYQGIKDQVLNFRSARDL